MKLQISSVHIRIFGMMLLPLAFAGGCRTGDTGGAHGCNDIPPGAIPQPNGTFACQWQAAQIARGREDRLVVYENEWYLGGKELGQFGQQHVADLTDQLKHSTSVVVVEPHFNHERNAPDDELNQARVNAIIVRLAQNGVNDATNRVTLAQPQAEGLYGEDAVRIGAMRLQSIRNASGGGTSSGGQFGGIGSTPMSGGVGGIGVGSAGY